MKNKIIIIILIVIIIILAAAIGVSLLNPQHVKEPTKIQFTSNKTQFENGNISIQLTDLNSNSLSNEIVNITIKNSTNGEIIIDDVVKTNSNGVADFNFNLNQGGYEVTVYYGGSQNYSGNKTTQNLTIEEEVLESHTTSSQSSQQNSQRQEDQITSSGWDPKQHEVSRESVGDGNERVKFDDGYFRLVDKDGNIISYGYGD